MELTQNNLQAQEYWRSFEVNTSCKFVSWLASPSFFCNALAAWCASLFGAGAAAFVSTAFDACVVLSVIAELE